MLVAKTSSINIFEEYKIVINFKFTLASPHTYVCHMYVYENKNKGMQELTERPGLTNKKPKHMHPYLQSYLCM